VQSIVRKWIFNHHDDDDTCEPASECAHSSFTSSSSLLLLMHNYGYIHRYIHTYYILQNVMQQSHCNQTIGLGCNKCGEEEEEEFVDAWNIVAVVVVVQLIVVLSCAVRRSLYKGNLV